jgi:hypothetical protein
MRRVVGFDLRIGRFGARVQSLFEILTGQQARMLVHQHHDGGALLVHPGGHAFARAEDDRRPLLPQILALLIRDRVRLL